MEKPPLVVIIGDSGTGKSSLLETLPPERTVIINTENKPLPMENFTQFKNFYITDWKALTNILDKLNTPEMTEKYDFVVLDSFTSMTEMVLRYAEKVYTGWDVWGKYNDMIADGIFKMKKLNLQCFVIALPEQKAEQFGETKSYARVKGKDLKFGYLEKEVAIVLFTEPEYAEQDMKTYTNKNGKTFVDVEEGDMIESYMRYKPSKKNSAKAPSNMFTGKLSNDGLMIANKIKEYYNVQK